MLLKFPQKIGSGMLRYGAVLDSTVDSQKVHRGPTELAKGGVHSWLSARALLQCSRVEYMEIRLGTDRGSHAAANDPNEAQPLLRPSVQNDTVKHGRSPRYCTW